MSDHDDDTDDIDRDDDERGTETLSVEERLDRIEGERTSQRLANEHGLSLEHAAEVDKLTRSGLAEDEALLVIEKRHGPPRRAHGQLRPKAAGAPRRSSEPSQPERLDAIRELSKSDKRKGAAAFRNEVGAFLAQAMGWEHHRRAVPKAGPVHR